MKRQRKQPSVILVSWNNKLKGEFSLERTQHLANELRKHGLTGDFFCITNTVSKIIHPPNKGGLTLLPFKDDYQDLGWWCKMDLYRPAIRKRCYPAWFFDIDTVVTGDLADLNRISIHAPFMMLRDFHHPHRGGQSSVLYLPNDASLDVVWARWRSEQEKCIRKYPGPKVGGEQVMVSDMLKPTKFLQGEFPRRFVSFKPTRKTFLKNPSEENSIVVFHGDPRPWEPAVLKLDWVAQFFGGRKDQYDKLHHSTVSTPAFSERYDGTLVVLGSAKGAVQELEEVYKHRSDVKVMSIGHASATAKADFIQTDHYENFAQLINLQSKFHSRDHFSTHCSRGRKTKRFIESKVGVDYWWDQARSDGTSVHSAIQIGLQMGFEEIILCGNPMEAGIIQHPLQRMKDGVAWPPPRADKEYDSHQTLQEYQERFRQHAWKWEGKITSMSGFTRKILGAPSWLADKEKKETERPIPSTGMVSILCPTRARPQIAKRMIQSITATAVGEVEILLYVDDDDPFLEEYKRLNSDPVRVLIIGEAQTVGKSWNALAEKASGRWLMMGNDDLVFRTSGWDEILKKNVAVYKDEIFVAWFGDGTPNAPLRCAFPIVSQKWYKAIKRFTPECFNFLFHDAWVSDVARRIGRLHYIGEVLVEHLHFNFKKAEYDETYRRHREGNKAKQLRKEDWAKRRITVGERQAESEILLELIGAKQLNAEVSKRAVLTGLPMGVLQKIHQKIKGDCLVVGDTLCHMPDRRIAGILQSGPDRIAICEVLGDPHRNTGPTDRFQRHDYDYEYLAKQAGFEVKKTWAIGEKFTDVPKHYQRTLLLLERTDNGK